MNEFVERYFSPEFTDFEEVIVLHESPKQSLSALQAFCPALTKGWYELSQFDRDDRIEFVCGTWKKALGILPHLEDFITTFFDEIDDVGVFLFKQGDSWESRMVYSMCDGENYFQGRPPANDVAIAKMMELFDVEFPADYLAFLKIHNGFTRDTDVGILPIERLRKEQQVLQVSIAKETLGLLYRGDPVDPGSLFPFYKSLDLRMYQCFFTAWHPSEAMGNVLCSLSEGYLSDFQSQEESLETLAFPTFVDWLSFYIVGMEG